MRKHKYFCISVVLVITKFDLLCGFYLYKNEMVNL